MSTAKQSQSCKTISRGLGASFHDRCDALSTMTVWPTTVDVTARENLKTAVMDSFCREDTLICWHTDSIWLSDTKKQGSKTSL